MRLKKMEIGGVSGEHNTLVSTAINLVSDNKLFKAPTFLDLVGHDNG